MASLRQRSWFSGLVTGTVGFAAVAAVTEPLRAGGLAPLAALAVVAGLIGVPVARAEWRRREPGRTTRERAIAALGEVLLVAWLAAVWADVRPGLAGAAAGLGIWLVSWGLVRLRSDWSVFGLAVLCLLQACLGALMGWVEAPPWSLLQPDWTRWNEWLPWSISTGLLLASAGLAHWSRGAPPPPGTGQVPWMPAGLALLAVLGAACRAGSRFEADLAMELDPIAVGVAALAVGAAASAAQVSTPNPGRTALLGGALALWFGGPGAAGVDWLLAVWLPAGLAIGAGALALSLRGVSRLVAAIGTLLALVSLALGWPGVPESPPQAVAAALTGVGLLWIAGTRALLEAK